MFKNPGKSLKILAKVLFWLCVVSGSVLFVGGVGNDPLVASLIGVGGLVGAFLLALPIYAFGCMVEDTAAIRDSINQTTMVCVNIYNKLHQDGQEKEDGHCPE